MNRVRSPPLVRCTRKWEAITIGDKGGVLSTKRLGLRCFTLSFAGVARGAASSASRKDNFHSFLSQC